MDNILSLHNQLDFTILLCDFNIPTFVHDLEINKFSISHSLRLSNLISLFDFISLTKFPTRKLSYLDLAFSSIPLICSKSPPYFTSDHDAFSISSNSSTFDTLNLK